MSIIVLSQCGQSLVVHPTQQEQVIVESAVQGPPGPPGKNGDGSGALLVGNRLSEFDTPAAREQAQANLGLGVADPLAYYILAKA